MKLLRRELQTGCIDGIKAFNTTFNNNENAFLYSGIMFAIKSLSSNPITINSFELDVRLDPNTDNLAIEVYTMLNQYTGALGDPTKWTSIANTQAVPVPGGGGVLIPASDFQTVTMQPNEMRSFYITMTDRFLDNTAAALQRRGDLDKQLDGIFSLEVGAGFLKYKFPGEIDPTINPKFAGVIYYDENKQCGTEATTKTSMKFRFVVDDMGGNQAMVDQMNVALLGFFDEALYNKEGNLYQYVVDHKLAKAGVPYSIASPQDPVNCPSSFEHCTGVDMEMTFQHEVGLTDGEVLYELYGLACELVPVMQTASGKTVAYAGKVASSANIKFLIAGATFNTKMNENQEKYFQREVRAFVQKFADVDILALKINQQSINGPTLEVTGEIRGGQLINLPAENFVHKVESVLTTGESFLVQELSFDVLRPTSGLSNVDAGFFEDITSAQTELQPIEIECKTTTLQTVPPSAIGTNDDGGDQEKDKVVDHIDTGKVTGGVSDGKDIATDGVGKGVGIISDEAKDAGTGTWIIVGGIAVIVLIILLIAYFGRKLYMRHKMKRRDDDYDEPQSSSNKKDNRSVSTRSLDVSTIDRPKTAERSRSFDSNTSDSPRPMQRSTSNKSLPRPTHAERSKTTDGVPARPTLQTAPRAASQPVLQRTGPESPRRRPPSRNNSSGSQGSFRGIPSRSPKAGVPGRGLPMRSQSVGGPGRGMPARSLSAGGAPGGRGLPNRTPSFGAAQSRDMAPKQPSHMSSPQRPAPPKRIQSISALPRGPPVTGSPRRGPPPGSSAAPGRGSQMRAQSARVGAPSRQPQQPAGGRVSPAAMRAQSARMPVKPPPLRRATSAE